jgi:hypothetical protein
MRIHWSHALVRSELVAAVTVMAVLVAGTLAKLGYGGWGIAVVAGFCLAGSVIEHMTSAVRSNASAVARMSARSASAGKEGCFLAIG